MFSASAFLRGSLAGVSLPVASATAISAALIVFSSMKEKKFSPLNAYRYLHTSFGRTHGRFLYCYRFFDVVSNEWEAFGCRSLYPSLERVYSFSLGCFLLLDKYPRFLLSSFSLSARVK